MSKISSTIFYSNLSLFTYASMSYSKQKKETKSEIRKVFLFNTILLIPEIYNKIEILNRKYLFSLRYIGIVSCSFSIYGFLGPSLLYDILGNYYIDYIGLEEKILREDIDKEKVWRYIENNEKDKEVTFNKDNYDISMRIIDRRIVQTYSNDMNRRLSLLNEKEILKASLKDKLSEVSIKYYKYSLYVIYFSILSSIILIF